MLQAERDHVAALASSIKDGTLQGVVAWDKLHDLQEQGVSIEEIFKEPVKHLGEDGAILLPLLDRQP